MGEDTKVKEFTEKFVQHGMGCGDKIGEVLQKRHPKAKVFSLYRSAVAIEYDEEERIIRLFTAGDPHVWGEDLIDKNVDETEYIITGNRFGPFIHQIIGDRAVAMKST